jgi:hypothetical protein
MPRPPAPKQSFAAGVLTLSREADARPARLDAFVATCIFRNGKLCDSRWFTYSISQNCTRHKQRCDFMDVNEQGVVVKGRRSLIMVSNHTAPQTLNTNTALWSLPGFSKEENYWLLNVDNLARISHSHNPVQLMLWCEKVPM